MSEHSIDFIVSCMATSTLYKEIQKIQTEHRLKLAEIWRIKEGEHVLEIGCGQGDTTAVLAYMVGEKGQVHGVDLASPSYGEPITLGDSMAYLKKSKLGKQVKVDFEFDILSANYKVEEFDAIVISHCSWYMSSPDILIDILKKVRPWGKKLCFAEWDTRVEQAEQVPHFLAALIQAQYECFKEVSISNIRTLLSRKDIEHAFKEGGWDVMDEVSIYSPNLQDAEWEVQQTLHAFETEFDSLKMPRKMNSLLRTEISLLEEAVKGRKIKPLNVFALVGE
ncbi:class I SAM-dependent methyltransferase [Bacillus coreaensis]